MSSVVGGDYAQARAACDTLLAVWVTSLDATVEQAVKGDRLAARSYATSYVELANFLARELSDQPDEQHWMTRIARREAYSLPFRSCTVEDRPGLSITLTLLSDMRHMTVLQPLDWPQPCTSPLGRLWDLDDRGVSEFERVVDQVVDGARTPLEELLETFDLSHTDAGRLFGVTRQAIAQWLTHGVPSDRLAKVTTVAQIASLLRHNLVSERIPGIARKTATAYGDRTMLEMIAANDHDRLHELTRQSFDWSTAA